MASSNVEQVFGLAALEILTPSNPFILKDASAEGDKWLEKVKTGYDRRLAFYDEHLRFLLAIQLPHPIEDDPVPSHPPGVLLSCLSRVQVSVDASYVSPYTSAPATPIAPQSRGQNQPRSSSLRPGASGVPPALLPPNTPNPTPTTTDIDRKYMRSEGLAMSSFVWGEGAESPHEDAQFALFWSEKEEVWVALYRTEVTVAFLRTRSPEPLLCLTVSATLRDKAVPATPARAPLRALLEAASAHVSPEVGQEIFLPGVQDDDEKEEVSRFEEVNLLEGLQGPSFGAMPGRDSALELPTTRLPPSLRREVFSLPPLGSDTPIVSAGPTHTPVTARQASILRKSFRKVLPVISGIKVRMRTTFLPNSDLQDDDGGPDGERAVVLCVEVENSGEAGSGFLVEQVDVNVSGDDAKTSLISWSEDEAQKIFPLTLHASDQYNILYDVAFANDLSKSLDSPVISSFPSQNNNRHSLPLQAQGPESQRSVSIVVHGRPLRFEKASPETPIFQTETFASVWNCQIDVTAGQSELIERPSTPLTARDVLPTPSSPFHVSLAWAANHPNSAPATASVVSSVAGSKRHTFAGLTITTPAPTIPTERPGRPDTARSFTLPTPGSLASFPFTSSSSLRFGPTPPSSAGGSLTPRGPAATINTPRVHTPQPPPLATTGPLRQPYQKNPATPSTTPYASGSHSQSPFSQTPAAAYTGTGNVVEPRRDRPSYPVPSSPGQQLVGPTRPGRILPPVDVEPVLISVGLQYPHKGSRRSADGRVSRSDRIEPLDTFSLEIFVFNQSSVIRRLLISYPDRKRNKYREGEDKGDGIVPLENHKHVGPLQPGTCQSVQMPFLALRPGVHAIEVLSVHDPDTGYMMNLRQVMSLVVHESESIHKP